MTLLEVNVFLLVVNRRPVGASGESRLLPGGKPEAYAKKTASLFIVVKDKLQNFLLPNPSCMGN